jgi:hypothetical protein
MCRGDKSLRHITFQGRVALGHAHKLKLELAVCVKQSVKRQQTDCADAEATKEPALRPHQCGEYGAYI